MAPTQSKIANLKSKCSQTLSPVVPRHRLPRNGFDCQFANDFRTDADVAQPCKEPLAQSLSLPVLTSARYNLAALPHLNFSESTHAEPSRPGYRSDRHLALRSDAGPIARWRRPARTHASGRKEQFANHEDHAHVYRCVWATLDRIAESQSRRRMGSQTDDRVGTFKRSSRALGFWA